MSSWQYSFKKERLLCWHLKVSEFKMLSLFVVVVLFGRHRCFLSNISIAIFSVAVLPKWGSGLYWCERTGCFLQISSSVTDQSTCPLDTRVRAHTHTEHFKILMHLIQAIEKKIILFVQLLSLQRQNVMKCKSENSGFCTVKVKVLWITSRMRRPGVLHWRGQWWSKPSLSSSGGYDCAFL